VLLIKFVPTFDVEGPHLYGRSLSVSECRFALQRYLPELFAQGERAVEKRRIEFEQDEIRVNPSQNGD
jgi:hypothetical protein